ncbi:MAG: hypothetical protein NTX45_25045 [Proteobacteria bacterium]|nr:hypothetical protein [Pseudomonadota bacterium]
MKTKTVNTVDAIELKGMRLLTEAELDEVSGGKWYSGIVKAWKSIWYLVNNRDQQGPYPEPYPYADPNPNYYPMQSKLTGIAQR